MVIVVVNAPIGFVYTHFTADIVAVPLFWTIHKSQTRYFDALREIHVS